MVVNIMFKQRHWHTCFSREIRPELPGALRRSGTLKEVRMFVNGEMGIGGTHVSGESHL